jgi:hypothetical protein
VAAVAADDVRRLYGLPPERFTTERDALAKQLRQAGDAEAAAEVKALRRPTMSAWAVNQLVRERTPLLRDLWKAGDKLRKAHEGKGDFRAALDAEREALQALAASAAELLEQSGQAATNATLQRVTGTLQAAAADSDARTAVGEGMLDKDLEPPGFEALG